MSEDCLFCRIARGELPSETVFEDERTFAFMDINPATDGHTLVIPKAHAEDIWGLSDDDGVAMWRTVRRVADAIREALNPAGMNLVQANREAGWQEVFHFHMHVVPRYAGDGLTKPWEPRPGDPETISDIAERLRSS